VVNEMKRGALGLNSQRLDQQADQAVSVMPGNGIWNLIAVLFKPVGVVEIDLAAPLHAEQGLDSGGFGQSPADAPGHEQLLKLWHAQAALHKIHPQVGADHLELPAVIDIEAQGACCGP